jgi:hypothetical protein
VRGGEFFQKKAAKPNNILNDRVPGGNTQMWFFLVKKKRFFALNLCLSKG